MNKQDEEKARELDKKFREIMFSPKEYHFTDCLLEMAAWKEQQTIEKAVKWLETNTITVRNKFGVSHTELSSKISKKKYIEDFKKAMEGE